MRPTPRQAFTIIELLVVVIIVGLLAAAGVAKYQNNAEQARRKICISNLQTLEKALAVWEMTTQTFAENSKCAFGFTPRSGKLTNYSQSGATRVLAVGATVAALLDRNQATSGAPATFVNNAVSGPLSKVIRDDRVWVCPSAFTRFYGGEIQFIPDDYLDTSGRGVTAPHRGTSIGMGGRYFAAVAGRGKTTSGVRPINNTGFPAGWISGVGTTGLQARAVNALASPCPQTPFKLALCGCYGTFGPYGTSNTTPGRRAYNTGGAVGPNGSWLSRHSARW